jgi:outer membrane protein assembly factor BamA
MSKIYGKSLSFLLFLAFFYISSPAQTASQLSIKAKGADVDVLSNYRYDNTVSDSLSALRVVNQLLSALHNDGYLLARQTEFGLENETFESSIQIGQRFEWLALEAGNLDRVLMRRAGFREKRYYAKPFRFSQIARLQDRLLAIAEESGYPFAQVSIDSLHIVQNQIGGVLNFDQGPLITFDSIDVQSDLFIKIKFLGSFLDIKMGNPYNHKRIASLSQSLARLPYLKLAEAPTLTFQNSEATLHLKLAKRRINQVDGIIGFLPNANNDNQLLITGQFDIELYNPFGSGKKIGLHWRKQNVETQTLNLEYEHPNVLGSPLGARLEFDFLKQDTSFTRRDLDIELSYRMGASGSFTVFTQQQITNLIATQHLANATRLPEVINAELASYGISFRWNSLDDIFLPKRGMRFSVKAAAGNKKLKPGNELPPDLLTGVDLKNLQYTLAVGMERHSLVAPNFVLFNSIDGGLLLNDRLFRNDAVRLGGLNSLRGFNENFFFATRYATATVEGRLFFDELSFFSVFTDLGVVYEDFSEEPFTDYPVGLGAGISFSTDAGIFNFVYAVGRSDIAGALSLNQSKIHFGFTSRF